jgi:hypothetical protein
MKKLLPVIAALLLAFPAFAQSDLPKFGSLADIKGMTKFYAKAGPIDREKIVKVLTEDAKLISVNDPEDAQIFVEFKSELGEMFTATAEMYVYYMREGKRVLAWSDTRGGTMLRGHLAGKLSGKFAKDLNKAK